MAEEKQYEYGMTPEQTGDGLLSFFSKIWGPDRSPLTDFFTGTRREIISPRKEEYEKYWTGLEGEYRYRKKVTPGEYGEPEHDLEYMPAWKAAQGIGSFIENIFSSPEAREEAADALVKGIGQIAEDQTQAISNIAAGGEGRFYDPEKDRVVGFDPLLISSPSFAAGMMFPPKGPGVFSGMFAGRTSPAADLPKLKVAEDTAAKRNYGKDSSRQENEATRNDIFEETGWFRYHDNDGNPVHDWRFEISDHQAEVVHDPKFLTPKGRLKGNFAEVSDLLRMGIPLNEGDTPLLVSDLLRHPELFSAYSGEFGPGEAAAKRGENLAQQLDRVSSSARASISLEEITRQRAAIKLKLDELKKSNLDPTDPVYEAEYQRLQAEDGAILDRLIAGEIADTGKKPDKPVETTDPESKLKQQPLAKIPLVKMPSKESGSAYYSPWTDTIGIKKFPGHPMSWIDKNTPWDEKGVYTSPWNNLKFARKEKEAKEMFRRAGISLDSTGSYSSGPGTPTDIGISDIEFSLRKWKGTDAPADQLAFVKIDPADLPPHLKKVWDKLHDPVTRYYKKDYDPTLQFVGSALHEFQHSIQGRHPELSSGSNVKEFRRHTLPGEKKDWIDPETGKKYSNLKLYLNTLGEGEARNTDYRQDLTPLERKEPGKRPWETLEQMSYPVEEGDLRSREQLGLAAHRTREASGIATLEPSREMAEFTEGPPVEIGDALQPSLVTSEGGPPRFLYRIISQQEYDAAQEKGYLSPSSSYGRHHASASPESQYLEPENNVLLRIIYSPEDEWYSKWGGNKVYGVSSKDIPFSRAEKITSGSSRDIGDFLKKFNEPRPTEQSPLSTMAEADLAALDLSMEPEIVAQRASDQGFTLDAYHFTPSPEDFEEFIPGGPAFEVDEKGNFDAYGSNQLSGPATWFSATPEGLRSAGFRGSVDKEPFDVMPEGSRVLPVKIRVENPLYIDALNREEMADRFFTKDLDSMYSLRSEFPWLLNQPTVDKLREAGFDTIIMSSPDADPEGMIFPEKADPMAEYIVLDNRNIRSKYARFDPAQSKEAGLNKAQGGLVQGPLSVNPDMSKVSAGFIDKPLYDRFL